MRVALITGSRADRGALEGVERALKQARVATDWIYVWPYGDDSWPPGNSALGAANACKDAAIDLKNNEFTWVIVHGDRYEILGATTAAFLLGFPIVHLGGGDITEGSQDSSIRDAITCLSHLHFTTCKESARRLLKMGVDPTRVHNTGDPGTDIFFTQTDYPSPFTLSLIRDPPNYLLVAYHPNTLGDTAAEVKILEQAIQQFHQRMSDIRIILLDPNQDAGNEIIADAFGKLADNGQHISFVQGLNRPTYLGFLKHATALVGNSSAAFYEAPYFGTPVITFGDRQKGRHVSKNHVASVKSVSGLVDAMVKVAKNPPNRVISHPYGDGTAGDRIVKILQKTNPKALLKKKFY